jgi:hypothetical protein
VGGKGRNLPSQAIGADKEDKFYFEEYSNTYLKEDGMLVGYFYILLVVSTLINTFKK